MILKQVFAAQNEIGGYFEGPGPLGNTFGFLGDPRAGAGKAVILFSKIMSSVIGLLTVIAGLYFVFTLITGALAWLSAGGDKMATENAQKRITHGLIGLVIIIAGIFLIDIIGGLLGLDILSPGNFVLNIW